MIERRWDELMRGKRGGGGGGAQRNASCIEARGEGERERERLIYESLPKPISLRSQYR